MKLKVVQLRRKTTPLTIQSHVFLFLIFYRQWALPAIARVMTKPFDFPRLPFAWQLEAPTAQFENPWMRVDTIPAIDPSGKQANYGLVHFKNLAIGIIPYEDGHVWLVGQSRVAFQEYSWEIPAGGDPNGEDPEGTAHRELREETGLRAAHMQPILTLEISNSVSDERGLVFLATGLTAGVRELESSEDITVQKVSLDTALKAVDDGEIRQALSVSGLLKLGRMRTLGLIDG